MAIRIAFAACSAAARLSELLSGKTLSSMQSVLGPQKLAASEALIIQKPNISAMKIKMDFMDVKRFN
jgi:hypothetical protein